MAARRTNKTHVIRQTTGEKYPTSVVDPGPIADDESDVSDVDTDLSEGDVAVPDEDAIPEDGVAVSGEPLSSVDVISDQDDVDREGSGAVGTGGAPLDEGPEEVPAPAQKSIFDLFSQEVTGSEAAAADVGFPQVSEDVPSAPEAFPDGEPDALTEDVDEEMPMEEATPEIQSAAPADEPPEAVIDEDLIEEGAPNGSVPLVDAPMLDEQLGQDGISSPEGGVSSAEGTVLMLTETQNTVLKTIGTRDDVLAYARAAGIMAGKRAGELVPTCPAHAVSECAVDIHPIAASGANVLRGWRPTRKDGRAGFYVQATCAGIGTSDAQTQALAAVSAACLSIFDMVEEDDATMEVVELRPLLPERPAMPHVVDEEPGEEEPEKEGEPEEEKIVPASPLPGGAGTGTPAPAIAFVGFQNSGKTTLVERVISNLTKRGLRIGSIKLHGPKGFEIDQPGKDSWRHAQAGSRHVGLISPDQYAEYASTSKEVPVSDLLTHYTDVDLVIVEGLRAEGIPSIVVARSGVDRIRGISSYDLINDDTLAIACNEVTARGFRAQWDKMRDGMDELGNPDLPVEPPAFLDINDVPEIVSFIMDYLRAE